MVSPAAEATKLAASDVLGVIEEVEQDFRALDERGLFANSDSKAKEVIQLLTAAFRALDSGDAVTGNEKALEADCLVHQVLYDRTWWWRFRMRFQPMIVLYNLAILAYLLFAGGWRLNATEVPAWLILPEEIWQVPVAVLAFGAAGAVLRVFYWLHLKIAKGENRPRNQLGYFLAPWIGALFGAIVYAVVRAGLWTFQGEVAEVAKTDDQKLWAILALAALAGYSWEWITQWLSNVMSQIAQRGGVPPKPAEPAAGAAAPAVATADGAAATTGAQPKAPAPEAEPEPGK